MIPKGMVDELLADCKSEISSEPIICDEIIIEAGQEIRKHQAGSFQVAIFVVVGFISPKARAIYEDGRGWESMWELATEEQRQVPGVLLQIKGREQYEIWTPRDVAGQIKTNKG